MRPSGLATSNIRWPISISPRKHLGYEVQVDFREGLRRTVEWYKSIMKPEPARS